MIIEPSILVLLVIGLLAGILAILVPFTAPILFGGAIVTAPGRSARF